MTSIDIQLVCFVDSEQSEAETTILAVQNYDLLKEGKTATFSSETDERVIPDALKPIHDSVFVDEAALSMSIVHNLVLITHTVGRHSSIGGRVLRGLRSVIGPVTPINNTTPSKL